MFDEAKSGLQHNITMNTNMKALKFFTISPSLNYKEVWYLDRLSKKFDDVKETVVTDTISGFNAFREYNASVSLGTTFYGMFKFKKGSKIDLSVGKKEEDYSAMATDSSAVADPKDEE